MQNLHSRLRGKQRAFTLIELLVVILIIAVLIAVAAPTFLGQQSKAHDSAAKQNLTVAYKAAKADAVSRDPQGAFGSAADVRAVLAQNEPQMNVAASGTPAEGEVAVCDDSDSDRLRLSALSKSGESFALEAPANGKQTVAEGSCSGTEDEEPDAGELVDYGCGTSIGRQTQNFVNMSVGSPDYLDGKSEEPGYSLAYIELYGGDPALSPVATHSCYTRGTTFSYQSGFLTTATGLHVMGIKTADWTYGLIPIPSEAESVEVEHDGRVSYLVDGDRVQTEWTVYLTFFALGDGEWSWTENEMWTDLGEGVLFRAPAFLSIHGGGICMADDGYMCEPIVGT